MEADTLFQLELAYVTKEYPSLAERALSIIYSSEKRKYLWTFYMKDLEEVTNVLGTPITFTNQADNINKLIKLCPPVLERIEFDRYKGKGEYTFIEEPDIFLVGEWQKDPITGKPKQTWYKVPKEVVVVNWDIIKGYPFDKWIKIKTQAEHVCRRLGFDRVFRADSGTFDWSKFIGLHRKGHLPYVYYPVKILANFGVISYSKAGKLKRIKENLEFQRQFSKPIPLKDVIVKR